MRSIGVCFAGPIYVWWTKVSEGIHRWDSEDSLGRCMLQVASTAREHWSLHTLSWYGASKTCLELHPRYRMTHGDRFGARIYHTARCLPGPRCE